MRSSPTGAFCWRAPTPTPPKAKGISFLIVDMRSPGITIRPLRQMTGSEEFNEVFLEDVRVPVANLVGEIDTGLVRSRRPRSATSAARRRASWSSTASCSTSCLSLARSTRHGDLPASADPALRQRLAQAFIEVEMTKLHNWRTLTQLRRHGKPGPGELAGEALLERDEPAPARHRDGDPRARTASCWPGEPRAVARGRWLRSYLYYRPATIFAGTSEIQRNIIAQRVLGLPQKLGC